MNAMSLRFVEEVGGIAKSFRIETTVPDVVVIETVLDEAAVIDAEAAVNQDLFVFRGNRYLSRLGPTVVDPDIEQHDIAGLVWNGDWAPSEEIGGSVPPRSLEDDLLAS